MYSSDFNMYSISLAGQDGKAKLNADVSHVRNEIIDCKALVTTCASCVDNSLFKNINEWLKPEDQTFKYYRILESRIEGTCKWFLKDERYTDWMVAVCSILWYHGGST